MDRENAGRLIDFMFLPHVNPQCRAARSCIAQHLFNIISNTDNRGYRTYTRSEVWKAFRTRNFHCAHLMASSIERQALTEEAKRVFAMIHLRSVGLPPEVVFAICPDRAWKGNQDKSWASAIRYVCPSGVPTCSFCGCTEESSKITFGHIRPACVYRYRYTDGSVWRQKPKRKNREPKVTYIANTTMECDDCQGDLDKTTNALTRAVVLCVNPTLREQTALLRAIVWFNSMWGPPSNKTDNAKLLWKLFENPDDAMPRVEELRPHVDRFLNTWKASPHVWDGADTLIGVPPIRAILKFLAV